MKMAQFARKLLRQTSASLIMWSGFPRLSRMLLKLCCCEPAPECIVRSERISKISFSVLAGRQLQNHTELPSQAFPRRGCVFGGSSVKWACLQNLTDILQCRWGGGGVAKTGLTCRCTMIGACLHNDVCTMKGACLHNYVCTTKGAYLHK